MKKIVVAILVLIFFAVSSLSYIAFSGGLNKYWPVVGESITPVHNAYYYALGFSIQAADKMVVRRGVEFGTRNQGVSQVSLMNGRVLITLLGNSNLTVSDVSLAKVPLNLTAGASGGGNVFRDKNSPEKTAGGNKGGQSPAAAFMPEPDNPAQTGGAAESDSGNQELDKLMLSDFTGIAFLELHSPLLIHFDGPGVIGNGLRLRLAPYNVTQASAGKTLQYPVRLLLFKPEKRRGMESVICLTLPDGFTLEVWLNDHRGYAMGRQTQFAFNRTPGVMETELLSADDNDKLIRWLQMEGVWSGASLPASLNKETRQMMREILDDSLNMVSSSLSPTMTAELKALIYEWWMLGWTGGKANGNVHAPQPRVPLTQPSDDELTEPIPPVSSVPPAPPGVPPMPAGDDGSRPGPGAVSK